MALCPKTAPGPPPDSRTRGWVVIRAQSSRSSLVEPRAQGGELGLSSPSRPKGWDPCGQNEAGKIPVCGPFFLVLDWFPRPSCEPVLPVCWSPSSHVVLKLGGVPSLPPVRDGGPRVPRSMAKSLLGTEYGARGDVVMVAYVDLKPR